MPELRIQADHDSLSLIENTIQDYNFNAALRTLPLAILAFAVLSWLNPIIPVALVIIAAFATGIWLRNDSQHAAAQNAVPTAPAPLLPPPPPPPSPSRGPHPPDQAATSYQGSPFDQGRSARPSSPCDRPPLYNRLRPTTHSPPPQYPSEPEFQSAPESELSHPLGRCRCTHGPRLIITRD